MADKEKKKGSFLVRLVVLVVAAVAVIHLAARFGKIEALRGVDVIGMAIGYGD